MEFTFPKYPLLIEKKPVFDGIRKLAVCSCAGSAYLFDKARKTTCKCLPDWCLFDTILCDVRFYQNPNVDSSKQHLPCLQLEVSAFLLTSVS